MSASAKSPPKTQFFLPVLLPPPTIHIGLAQHGEGYPGTGKCIRHHPQAGVPQSWLLLMPPELFSGGKNIFYTNQIRQCLAHNNVQYVFLTVTEPGSPGVWLLSCTFMSSGSGLWQVSSKPLIYVWIRDPAERSSISISWNVHVFTRMETLSEKKCFMSYC